MAFTDAQRDAIEDTLASNAAAGIAESQIGSERVRAVSLKELRELQKDLAGDVAATKPHRGLILTRLIPPGCG